MTTNIYILKLQNDNYYVGKAKDPNKRFQEHILGNGSSWTKKHEPIEIMKVINNCSPFEEDKQVKELMSLYGIDKVRGGSYSKIDLSQEEKETLQKEIWGAKDLCIRCGNSNHFVKDCYATKDINGNKIEDKEIVVWICENCDKEFENIKSCEKHEKICKQKINKKCCNRCGRQNHNSNNCYATTHKDGYEIDDNENELDCSSKQSDSSDLDDCCFRCGREGHFANGCYAKKHINGYYIN